jgi:large subunit ribosomal protein L17
MRHQKKSVKLGRSPSHRKALVESLVSNFIAERRIRTTLPKARLARQMAEKMVTLAKLNTLAARRQAIAVLQDKSRVSQLFSEIAPQFKDRKGGYTRITKIGRRIGDGAEMVYLEWVGLAYVDRRKKEKTEAKDQPAKAKDKSAKAEDKSAT